MSDDAHVGAQWWESQYQGGHTPWDREGVNPALYHCLDTGILTPGRIFVPGCGRGHEVVKLARLGFDVTALDIAPSPIAFLRQRLSDEGLWAQVVQTDLFAWEPERPFDAIYEQTSLCALSPVQWPAYSERLHRWLRPAGSLFALFMQTGQASGPPFHCDISEMRRLFPENRWRWPNDPPLEIPHPVGFIEKGYVLRRQGDG